MRVTQKDIARAVGVSQAVVSDVLHNRPRGRVSAETRERIVTTARRMGYQPNAAARALRSNESRQIVYMTSQSGVAQFDALSERIIGGLVRELARWGYRLLLEVARTPEEQHLLLRETIAAGACDGCVVRTHAQGRRPWEPFKALERPVVVIGQCADPELTSVAHDAPATVRAAISHLYERGHRRIGLVASTGGSDYYRLIQSAWEETAPRLLEQWDRWNMPGTDRVAAETVVSEWLAGETAPTAILCMHERAAVGVTDALRHAGRSLTEDFDLLIVGNISYNWLYEPGTWTFGTDLDGIGRRAASELLQHISGTPSTGPIRVLPELSRL